MHLINANVLILLLATVSVFVDCFERSTNFVGKKDGLQLPKLGVGLLDIKTEKQKENALVWAFKAGYRMVDIWESDELAVQAAIKRSKVPRKEIFIVVKIMSPTNETEVTNLREGTSYYIEEIMEKLETNYLDLVLIDYPYMKDAHFDIWKTLIELKNSGQISHIGVSNFRYNEIKKLIKATSVLPSVAQLEISPFNQQSSTVKKLANLGIAIQAYSVLTNGKKLKDRRLVRIADAYDATTAQLLIQWCIQKGYSCITKSTNKQHLQDNINLGEFYLEDEDMEKLDGMDEGFFNNFNAESKDQQPEESSNDNDDDNDNVNDGTVQKKSTVGPVGDDLEENAEELKTTKGRMGDDLDDDAEEIDDDAEESSDDDSEPSTPSHSDPKGKLGNSQRHSNVNDDTEEFDDDNDNDKDTEANKDISDSTGPVRERSEAKPRGESAQKKIKDEF
eukprot:gene14236-15721_t